jgi:hypothetical protein
MENNLPSELLLMDVSGKIILEKTFTNFSNIDLSNFKNGIYLIDVKNNLGTVSEKISVQ